MDVSIVLGKFDGVHGRSGHWSAKCPCHDDKTASLSIDVKPGKDGKSRIFLYCHAGCATDAILDTIGLTMKDLIINPDPEKAPSGRKAGRGKASGTERGAREKSERSGKGAGAPGAGSGYGNSGAGSPAGGRGSGARTENVRGITVHTVGAWNGDIWDGMDEVKRRIREVRTDDTGTDESDAAGSGAGGGQPGGAGYDRSVDDPVEMGVPGGAAGSVSQGSGVAGGARAGVSGGGVTASGGNGSGAAGASGNGNGDGGKSAGAGSGSGASGAAGDGGHRAGGNAAGDGDGAAKDELRIDWGHPDRVYPYEDEHGRVVFEVVRYHYLDGKPGKTFRQRMRDPGNPKANREGYVNSVPEEVREKVIYRMPRVLDAVRNGIPVYVVEGEKDVETLERMGCVATCNAGGAGKWRENYSRILAGADLIILPDNDPRNDRGGYPGQDHAFDVAIKSYQECRRIRIVNLKEACPELPSKGDVSDMMEIMGDVGGMDALQRQIAATKDFDPEMVPFWLTPQEQAERLYSAVTGYGAENGCICQYSKGALVPLCDFTVIPRVEKILDDGIERKRVFVLDGWNQKGQKLERLTISGGDLDGMGWVTQNWGLGAAIVPGSTTKAKVAWCIKKVGQMMSKTVVEYNHTGWRRIGDRWCYLFQGGAIGAEGVTVDLGPEMSNYRLDGGRNPEFQRMDPKEAARKSLRILDVARRENGIALLGTVFLAPLREWMSQTGVAPAYSLFLYGKTQTRKSTLAALAMSHFGNWHAKNAPANFHSTGNSISRMGFICKDAPFWVDDFHPSGSQQEKRQMNATAQRLARAFGDGAERGRLNADGSLQKARPPRSVAIITGEDLPDVGASGLARFFILNVERKDTQMAIDDGTMTELQEDARKGWLQKNMRGYIEWLAGNAKELPEYLHGKFVTYRDAARRIGSGDQERAPEAIACIMLGYNMMLSYYQHIGLFGPEEGKAMFTEAMKALTEASRQQSRDMESEKPTRIFLDTLSEMLATRRVWVKDLVIESEKNPYSSDNMVGWRDNEYYYLLPNMAYKEVSRVCREEGHDFPVSLKALYKHLREEGVVTGVKDGEPVSRPKYIDGKTVRVVRIPAKELDGDKADVQMEMQMTAVDGNGLPEGWV